MDQQKDEKEEGQKGYSMVSVLEVHSIQDNYDWVNRG